jgi:tRNA (mo5U34)-methyltransferase
MKTAQFMTSAVGAGGDLGAEAAELAPWFHNVHLPDGTQTAPGHPLGDFPTFKWREIATHLPEDLTGWSALDIGCNSGFYSVELARRGAHVTAFDKDPHFLKQARWVVDTFGVGHRVELYQAQVYDLAHWHTAFDLVLFMGVFYHLRYPQLALDIVAGKTNRLLVFQTLTMPGEEVVAPPDDLAFERREAMNAPGWPRMGFVEKSLAGDPTNWWAPNHACIEAMLRSTGLRVTARPGHEIYLCTPAPPQPDDQRGWKHDELLSATGSGSAVAHVLRQQLDHHFAGRASR